MEDFQKLEKIAEICGAKEWRERAEKAECQLAGCLVVATGGLKNPAEKGDYGWSVSYQQVLLLRKAFNKLTEKTPEQVLGLVWTPID